VFCVREWRLAPSEFWRLSMAEIWALWDALRPEERIGDLTLSEVEELHQLLKS